MKAIDGDVLTSAGVGAGIDLCLHVVRSDHGSAIANHAARRCFRDETGLSPARWLLQQRVAHAGLLLESTDLAVDVVARRSELGSVTALRQHPQATIGVAPSAYRRTFRLSTTQSGS